MKKGLYLFLVLILMFTVSAADFSIKATPIQPYALTTGIAEYNITVKNLKGVQDHIDFKPMEDLRFTPQSVPTYIIPSGITIDGYETKTFTLYLNPANNLGDGTYTLSLVAKSRNEDETLKAFMNVHVGEHESMYEPDVVIEPQIPENIDPRQQYSLKIALKNQNIINYDAIEISIIGDVINKETITPLKSREAKTIQIPLDIPKDSKPSEEKIRIKVQGKDTVFLNKEFSLKVLAYQEPFNQEEETKKSFLKSIRTIALTNPGNAKEVREFKLETTARERLFTSTSPKASIEKVAGKQFYVFDIALNPAETSTITVTKSYRLFSLLILLAIIGIIYYYLTRSPLTIRKQLVKIHYDDGAITHGTVRIFLKNRTGKPVTNVKIMEHLPSMFLVDKTAFHNTLEPENIYTTQRGPAMEYNLKVVDPHEDRIITYGFKSKLNVVGQHTIHPTRMKFKDHAHYKFSVQSNPLLVGKKEE